MLSNFNKPDAGSVDLNKALNDLIKLGQRDPNILLKYSQNPPPEYGSQGKLIVSLAASAVARDKTAKKTMEPAPTKTVAEQIDNKLVEATQPGIAGLTNQTAPMQGGINTTPQEPSLQAMNSGVANLPIDDGMYNEQNYAGGGIVSFAGGGRSAYKYKYPYESYYDDPVGSLMEIPDIPTADDLLMQQTDFRSRFVDPDFYEKEGKAIKDQTAEDVAETKKMGQADILFALAEGYGTTPGSFLRGTVAAGTKARPAVMEMNKNVLAAKRLQRDALTKLRQARYAESMGDYKTANDLREAARKDNFEAKKTNATLNTQIGVARSRALKNAGLDEAKLRVQVEKIATEKMKAQYPAGAFESLMRDRPDVYSAELNRYKQETENYILRNLSAKNLSADYMDKLQAKQKTKATLEERPLLNKYPPKGSRSTNTQAELDIDWDSVGAHEPEDEESQ
jgi:hypothetical protein